MDADTVKVLVSVAALILSIGSLVLAQAANRRSRKAEEVRNLLGEKEAVAFGALKLLRDGLPSSDSDRKLIIAAMMQACVFEGSDRSRALLFRVLELNPKYRTDFDAALKTVDDTYKSMNKYGFSSDELDISKGDLRIGATRKILLRSEPSNPVQ